MLRHLLLLSALAFAGVFWVSSQVSFDEDAAGEAQSSVVTSMPGPGASVPLR